MPREACRCSRCKTQENLINQNNSIRNISVVDSYNNLILVGSYSEGLFVLNKNLEIIQKIPLKKNIKSIIYNKSKPNIYLGIDEGIIVFNFENEMLKISKYLNEFDGLGKGRLKNLHFDKEVLYCSGNFITLINKTLLGKNSNGKVEINKVYNSDSIYNYSKHFSLPRENNNLTIKSSIKTFDNPLNFEWGNLLIRYNYTSM